MLIFGKEVEIKTRGCDREDMDGLPIRPAVNVFVKVSDACNAHCRFCSNAGRSGTGGKFDLPKLLKVVREFRHVGVRVNRVNVTGGEPSVVMDRTVELLDAFGSDEFADIHLHLNTNGVTRDSKSLMRCRRWNSISMSLHHYDPVRLAELYGIDGGDGILDFSGIDADKFNISCNLIKGYVDSRVEVQRMLDFAVDSEIPRIGFVALMKVNEFCHDHFVDICDVGIEQIPHVYFTESRNRRGNCRCSNYLYNRAGRVLEIYMRNYANPYYCESSVVYDGLFLRQGFHTNNVIV